ncbi:hypothetical protein T12_7908 [Trichinella patagoniensis]|uniref:Uncharacterized protein n=1 Tax=Trichinella patagoniensis TaxID=990121 RepID=A0A0V1ACU3_9BILA|nr:hypothetical protein T12_7908 [Trichinella patagoniensis]
MEQEHEAAIDPVEPRILQTTTEENQSQPQVEDPKINIRLRRSRPCPHTYTVHCHLPD